MTNASSVISAAATLLGVFFLVYRFGLNRERATFLALSVASRSVSQTKAMSLVEITVRLENKGATRISARRAGGGTSRFLYDDIWDRCEHAGTLKVRRVDEAANECAFDWYSLDALEANSHHRPRDNRAGELISEPGTLEQINYLGDYQDPMNTFRDVDFWLEPEEVYALTALLWLRPGAYVAKAFFLGQRSKHSEEEYWSSTAAFEIVAGSKTTGEAANGWLDRNAGGGLRSMI